MTSKFSLKSYFPILCIPPVAFGLTTYIIFAFNNTKSPPPLNGIPLILLLMFTITWLFFGEFRTKMTKVIIAEDFIIIKKFDGLSRGTKYLYSQIDGYKTSVLRSGTADSEYLYLIQDCKKIGNISEFYHKNYHDLKEELKAKLTYLGFEKFSYIAKLKEIFT